MHRYDDIKSDRALLEKRMMLNYRAALKRVRPDLLQHARALILEQAQGVDADRDVLVVDKEKSRNTIARYLEIKYPDNKDGIKRTLEALLRD